MNTQLTSVSVLKELIQQAMVNLTINAAPLATVAAKIGINIVEDHTDKHLAWTDGQGIFFNAPYIFEYMKLDKCVLPNGRLIDGKLERDHFVFIIAHEVGHIICRHSERAKNVGISFQDTSAENMRKFELWNIAGDHEINLLLKYNKKEGVAAPVGKLLDTVLCDDKYINMPAEQIYRLLLEEEQNKPNNSNSFSQSLVDKKSGKTTEVDASSLIKDLGEIDQDRFKQVVTEAFGSCSQGPGYDLSLNRLFELGQIIKPFNWKKALTRYMRNWIKNNYTWNVPSRAGLASGLILPSAGKTPKIHLAVAIDTSGSISNVELDTMMQHLFSILNQFKEFTVDVWCCGTKVFEDTFTTFTNKNKHKLKSYKIVSDGANDMEKNFRFIEKKYRYNKPDVFICMSDFYDGLDGNNEVRYNGDCIFMVIDHENFVPPKHIKAQVIPYEIANEK